MITLSIKQDGHSCINLCKASVSSRGTITNETTSSSPLWAGAGALGAVMAAIVVGAIAFSRREASILIANGNAVQMENNDETQHKTNTRGNEREHRSLYLLAWLRRTSR